MHTLRRAGAGLIVMALTRWASKAQSRSSKYILSRLVLLCPGFNLVGRWPELIGEEALQKWHETGFYSVKGRHAGECTDVWLNFLEDAQTHPPYPSVKAPTLIVGAFSVV